MTTTYFNSVLLRKVSAPMNCRCRDDPRSERRVNHPGVASEMDRSRVDVKVSLASGGQCCLQADSCRGWLQSGFWLSPVKEFGVRPRRDDGATLSARWERKRR